MCLSPSCALCSPNHAGVISEQLIKRYDVQERHPKGKTNPALHNTDVEQKKPRRKDTPAVHIPPFIAGKRAWPRTFAGGVGAGHSLTIWRCQGHGLCPSPPSCMVPVLLGKSCVYCFLSDSSSLAAPQGLTLSGED
jgi:hypothetical protein